MKEIIVELDMLDTKDRIHDFFSAELETPDWYGRNLDALYDELTSITSETVIRCYGRRADLPAYTKGLVDVLRDAATENRYLTIEME